MGWWIALGVLLLFAIMPLGVLIRYNDEGFFLHVIAGPVKVPVLPGKKKDPAQKKEKKKENKANKPAANKIGKHGEKPKEEKGGPITDFLPIVKTGLQLLNTFRKKLRVKRLDMKLILAGDDPCDLAINYGRANAAMGNLLPQLERYFVIKKRDIRVECDFETTATLIIVRSDITITLGNLLCILVFYGIRALKQFLQIKNQRKGGAKK